jgi:hypothetical protein
MNVGNVGNEALLIFHTCLPTGGFHISTYSHFLFIRFQIQPAILS